VPRGLQGGLGRRALPLPGDLVPGEVAPHYAAEPFGLLLDGKVAEPLQFGQLGAKPLSRRKAEESEGLGLPEPTGRSAAGGEAPELDQPRLAGLQFQGELREAFAKVTEELFGITEVLEAH